jgi:hypothetical protein
MMFHIKGSLVEMWWRVAVRLQPGARIFLPSAELELTDEVTCTMGIEGPLAGVKRQRREADISI